MNRTAILVAGTTGTAWQQNDWDITTVTNAEEAIEKIQQTNFDVVVFTAAVGAEERKLQSILSFQQPDAIIIKNANEALIANEIATALENESKAAHATYSIVDDGLKNAMLPITIQ